MKRFGFLFVLAVALWVGCAGNGALVEKGSVDGKIVTLLPNGKAQTVDVYSINDFHGALKEEGKNIGIGKLAAVLKKFVQVNPNSIILAGGDSYQGSALSNLTLGAPVSEFFKFIGLTASAIGNHEFDWGNSYFENWSKDGGFPFLAANIVDKTTGVPPVWAKPYIMVQVGGHKIAIIGLSTMETLSKTKASNISSFDFIDPALACSKYVTLLQSGKAPEGKPEVIIALTHIPGEINKADTTKVKGIAEFFELDALTKVIGLDAVICSHNHSSVFGTSNGVPVIEAYYNGRSIGHLSITFNADGTFVIVPSVEDVYKKTADLSVNEGAKAIYDKWYASLKDQLEIVVGTCNTELTHVEGSVSPLGKWVCDIMRKVCKTQIAITNGGGLRVPLTKGPVTMGKMYELMPFDNYAVTMDISGKVLKDAIEHGIDLPDAFDGQFSGVIVTYDPLAPYKSKIVSMKLEDGTLITDDGIYSVVINDFMYTGGDKYTMFSSANAKNIKETFIPIREMLVNVLKADKTIEEQTVNVLVKK